MREYSDSVFPAYASDAVWPGRVFTSAGGACYHQAMLTPAVMVLLVIGSTPLK